MLPYEVYVDTCQLEFELALRLNKPSRSDFLKSVPHVLFVESTEPSVSILPRGLNCVRALGDLKRKAKKLWTDHILSFAARLEIWDYQKPRKPNFPKAIDRDSNDQLVTCFISKRSQQDRTFEIQHYGKKTGSRTVALLNITFKINRKTRNIFSRDVGVSVQLWYIISLELYISLFFDPELN